MDKPLAMQKADSLHHIQSYLQTRLQGQPSLGRQKSLDVTGAQLLDPPETSSCEQPNDLRWHKRAEQWKGGAGRTSCTGHKATWSPLQAAAGQRDHIHIRAAVQGLTASHSQHHSDSGTASRKICFHRLGQPRFEFIGSNSKGTLITLT